LAKRLPANIGQNVDEPLLLNPWQQDFLQARRMRICATCQKFNKETGKTTRAAGYTGSDNVFTCPMCGVAQPEAKRGFRFFGLFAGRRGGKSLIGAHAAREEILTPNGIGWVMGPTYKILHDATMPTLLGIIPREWCDPNRGGGWNADDEELTLVNGHKIMFRSLDDPDRAHCGVGPHWGWMDEAAFISELAWHYFRPALTDHAGACFFTSSVDGYDWTYEHIEKKALVDKVPGYWACKWRTIDNPWIATRNPEEIEEARKTMPPQLFRQEYEAERENFEGSVYGEWLPEAWLPDDDAVQKYIPEWPRIDPNRKVILPLDSGSDHPVGSLAMVVTELGIVAVSEYLERQRAFSTHLSAIKGQFSAAGITLSQGLWCANRNESQLRTEFAMQGVLVAPAENNQEAGIQRVLSWLYTRQFKIAYTCPRLYDQMKTYRYANNVMADGSKGLKEKVFKLKDELPDCVRYGLMTWPSLPKAPEKLIGRDMSRLDPKTQWELEKMRNFSKGPDVRDLEPADKDYPMGDFNGGTGMTEDAFEGGYW
jgi:hypothetical protein